MNRQVDTVTLSPYKLLWLCAMRRNATLDLSVQDCRRSWDALRAGAWILGKPGAIPSPFFVGRWVLVNCCRHGGCLYYEGLD